jgi:hypothetical protein
MCKFICTVGKLVYKWIWRKTLIKPSSLGIDGSAYDCFILCLMQDLVPKVPRDWALETSVLESSDKGICTCDIEYTSFLIIFN